MEQRASGAKSNRRSHTRHIFSRYRRHIRLAASAVYLGFALFDYLYRPDLFWEWLGLRLSFVVSVSLLFWLSVKSKPIRNHMQAVASLTIALSCWPIVVMMAQSGGSQSLYLTGLLLCGTTGLQVFRLRKKYALVALLLSFVPAIFVIFSQFAGSVMTPLIQSGFLLGMIALSFIYGASEEKVDNSWQKFKTLTQEELKRYQRTEVLKNHFPKIIRENFEKNPGTIFQKKILPNAVIGFTDIVASSQISNEVPLAIDWDLKEKFLEAATQRAIASEIVVLTHLGDGFLFLANYNESSQWYYNLISFYEGVVADFRRISAQLNLQSTGIETGVKFGVSSGPIMVGFLGHQQSYFTAIGPDVNLASRLCAVAKPDQIVVSSRVWHSIRPLLIGWNFQMQNYSNIKGFDYEVSAVHISPRSISESVSQCPSCGSPMTLIRTEEGFLDYRCISSHEPPTLLQKV